MTELELLTKQLKEEVLPGLLASKGVLEGAVKTAEDVKAMNEQIKSLQGNLLEMNRTVMELGKKRIITNATGDLDDEAKIEFARYLVNMNRMRKNPNEQSMKIIRDIQKRYSTGKAADLQEGTDSEGGYWVPTMFSNKIWRIAEQASIALQMCMKVPLTSGYKLPILAETSGVTVVFGAEEASFTQTNPVPEQSTVSASKMNGYTVMSNELLEDEEIGLIDYLVMLFGEAMGAKTDSVLWNANAEASNGAFYGILKKSGVNTVTMTGGNGSFTKVTGDNLSSMISKIKSPALVNAKFFMHRTVFHYIRTLKKNSEANNYAYQDIGGSPVGTIWGYPVVLSEQMPSTSDDAVSTPFMVFGNLAYYLIGTKGEMTIKISDIPKILTDQTVMVARKRLAMGCAVPSAFCILKTSPVNS